MKQQTTELTYIDHEGIPRTIEGCTLTVDHIGRHWIWSEQLKKNLVYKTKGLENALLSAIDSLLFTIQLQDDRIKALQKIADAAMRFADEIKPDDDNDY